MSEGAMEYWKQLAEQQRRDREARDKELWKFCRESQRERENDIRKIVRDEIRKYFRKGKI